MLTFLIFILILSVLVLIHEFGHFYVAKKNGVRVDEFGFGLPPKVFGKKVGETEYTLNLLPFGGFVKLYGEDESDPDSYEQGIHDNRNYLSKTALQRFSILVAGIVMNTLLAIVLYYVFFSFTGFKSFTIPNLFDYHFRFGDVTEYSTVLIGYGEDSPAEQAGVQLGEAILEVNGERVYSVPGFKEALEGKAGEEVYLGVKDLSTIEQNFRLVKVVPVERDGEVIVGAFLGKASSIDYGRNKLLSGPMHAYNVMSYSRFTLSHLIESSVASKSVEPVSSSVSGPVGIFSVVGSILQNSAEIQDAGARFKLVMLSLIDLTALLSISLAFINALPFPALDGGRIFIIAIEVIRRKRVSPKFEAMFHQVGIIFLLGLLVLVTIRDVIRIF